MCSANNPKRAVEKLSRSAKATINGILHEHFGGKNDVRIEGEEGKRELVWRWTPEGEHEPQKIDVMYVFGTTQEATLKQQAKWMEHAVTNSAVFARDTCKMLGLTFAS